MLEAREEHGATPAFIAAANNRVRTGVMREGGGHGKERDREREGGRGRGREREREESIGRKHEKKKGWYQP